MVLITITKSVIFRQQTVLSMVQMVMDNSMIIRQNSIVQKTDMLSVISGAIRQLEYFRISKISMIGLLREMVFSKVHQ